MNPDQPDRSSNAVVFRFKQGVGRSNCLIYIENLAYIKNLLPNSFILGSVKSWLPSLFSLNRKTIVISLQLRHRIPRYNRWTILWDRFLHKWVPRSQAVLTNFWAKIPFSFNSTKSFLINQCTEVWSNTWYPQITKKIVKNARDLCRCLHIWKPR